MKIRRAGLRQSERVRNSIVHHAQWDFSHRQELLDELADLLFKEQLEPITYRLRALAGDRKIRAFLASENDDNPWDDDL